MTQRTKFSYVNPEMEQQNRNTNVARLRDIADDLERNLHEPDQLLCALQDLRRLADEIEVPLPRFVRNP